MIVIRTIFKGIGGTKARTAPEGPHFQRWTRSLLKVGRVHEQAVSSPGIVRRAACARSVRCRTASSSACLRSVISVTAPTNSQLPQRFGVLAAIVTGPFLHLPEGTISVTYQDWYI